MKPIAPPRRPETLHLALRYERLAREGRIAAASPYDPRIHASIDLGVEEEVALMARRYLNGFRGAGARQVAVMVAERPFQHYCRGGRLRALWRRGLRRLRLHAGDALAGIDAKALRLCAGLRARRAQGDRHSRRCSRGRLGRQQCRWGVSGADVAASGARQFAQRPGGQSIAPRWHRGELPLPARTRPARSRSAARILRRFDGDRFAADEAGEF